MVVSAPSEVSVDFVYPPVPHDRLVDEADVDLVSAAESVSSSFDDSVLV
jgi:hypothetical protein